MKSRGLTFVLVVSVIANVALVLAVSNGSPVRGAHADVTPAGEELSPYMSSQQRHMHKLGLAIQSKNKPLAEFYLTEVEEGFEVIQRKFPVYEKFQIAALSKAMFDPAKPPLKKALAASDWPGATTAYAGLVNACNTCHVAVTHDFVKVTVPTGNPFNQSFSPK